MDWVNAIIQGVLVGGLFALFATGLSLIFGVMRLVNIAHGDLIVLAAYIALMTTDTLGINPLLAILIVAPIMAAIGYCLQRALLNRTLGEDLLPPLLVTFGLSVIIQNALLELFTADSRRLSAGAIEVASFPLVEGVWIGVLPLLQFVVAVAVIGALQLLFYRTAFGDTLIDYLLLMKRAEIARYEAALSAAGLTDSPDEVSDWEMREYFEFF